MSSRDLFDAFRDDIRAQPTEPLTDVQIAAIVDRAITATVIRVPQRRRRWPLIASVLVFAGAGSGLAYAVLNNQHVAKPESGVACRAAASPIADAIVIGNLSSDPVGDCAALWADRRLPDTEEPDNNSGVVPRLVVCASPGGGVDVYPVSADQTCESLDLYAADIQSAAHDPVVELQRRLSDDLPRCSTISEAEAFARRALNDLDLESWKVVVRPGALPCALVGVDSGEQTVFIAPGPRLNAPTTTQGPP